MSSYKLFADYFQFYIQDEVVDGNLSNSWTEEAFARMLALAPGAIGIRTVRNSYVPVSVEFFNTTPGSDFSQWDHVVECTIEIKSPRLVIAGCTDYFPDAARINVNAGTYRVRACYSGLDTLSEDELEGEDKYELQLWLAPPGEPRVLKQRVIG